MAVVLLAGCGTGEQEAQTGGSAPVRALARRGDASYRAAAEIAGVTRASTETAGWDSERLWSPHVDWEPVVAVDPRADDVYQMTTRYHAPACRECPDPALVMRRSADGGATWGADRYISLAGQGQADPQLRVAVDGTLFAAFLQDFVPGVVFTRSTDQGETWSTPLELSADVPAGWSDKPWLAISRRGRHVYVAFNASDSYVAASHDFGETFAAPVRTNRHTRYWFHSGGVVAPNGDVYFAATDYSQSYEGESHINVLRSTDRGKTWSTIRVDTSAEAPACSWSPGCYLGYLGPSASLAVDSAGRLLIAYNANLVDGEPQALWVRSSRDGTTWGPRLRVSRASRRVHNAFPTVAAGPAPGDFRLVWQDDRRTQKKGKAGRKRWNTWYRRTADGGASWTKAVRLSDLGPEAAYKHRRGYRFPYGDYLGLDVDRTGANHVIWGEGRSLFGNGGSWYTRGNGPPLD